MSEELRRIARTLRRMSQDLGDCDDEGVQQAQSHDTRQRKRARSDDGDDLELSVREGKRPVDATLTVNGWPTRNASAPVPATSLDDEARAWAEAQLSDAQRAELVRGVRLDAADELNAVINGTPPPLPLTNQLGYLVRAIERVIPTVRGAWYFSAPVALLWPALRESYEALISRPMDLWTVRSRILEGTHYAACSDALRDVELVWSNCETFNGRQFLRDPQNELRASMENTRAALASLMADMPTPERPLQKGEMVELRVSTDPPSPLCWRELALRALHEEWPPTRDLAGLPGVPIRELSARHANWCREMTQAVRSLARLKGVRFPDDLRGDVVFCAHDLLNEAAVFAPVRLTDSQLARLYPLFDDAMLAAPRMSEVQRQWMDALALTDDQRHAIVRSYSFRKKLSSLLALADVPVESGANLRMQVRAAHRFVEERLVRPGPRIPVPALDDERAELEEVNGRRLESAKRCARCVDRVATTVNVPCGHRVLCVGCMHEHASHADAACHECGAVLERAVYSVD